MNSIQQKTLLSMKVYFHLFMTEAWLRELPIKGMSHIKSEREKVRHSVWWGHEWWLLAIGSMQQPQSISFTSFSKQSKVNSWPQYPHYYDPYCHIPPHPTHHVPPHPCHCANEHMLSENTLGVIACLVQRSFPPQSYEIFSLPLADKRIHHWDLST